MTAGCKSFSIIMYWLFSSCLCVVYEIALVSDQTPAETMKGLVQVQDLVQVSSQKWNGISEYLVFDFLDNLTLSLALLDQAGSAAQIVNGNNYQLSQESLFPSMKSQMDSFACLLEQLSIEELLMICSPDQLPEILQFSSLLRVSTLPVSSQLSSESLELLVRRTVKRQTVRAVLL